jgi:hypothetical protein
MKKEVLLFSGGPDSTVVLDYLVKKKDTSLIIVHCQLVWKNSNMLNFSIQKERVVKILNFYKNNNYSFEYYEPTLVLPFEDGIWGDEMWSDDQWSCFFGAMICKKLFINRMWSGYFNYTNENRKKIKGKGHDWAFNGELQRQCDLVSPNLKIKYTNPKLEFNGKEIDAIKDKKEAFLYLDPEVRKLVRSCSSSVDFCGTCYKCQSLILNNITDDFGNLIC